MTKNEKEEPTAKKKTEFKSFKHAIAGGLSGSITRCICQPLDVLKVRFQLQVEPIAMKEKSSKYKSIFHAIRLIIREEGFFSLWKGHNASQLMSILHGAVQFWTFERLMVLSKEALEGHGYARSFLCGAIAGGPAMMVSSPFDMIRTRLIAQDHAKGYKNATDGFKNIIKTEGALSLYKGIRPSLFQIVPFMGANFMFYTTLAELAMKFSSVEERGQLPTAYLLILGAIAGTVAKMLVYPFDLIKRRQQMDGFEKNRQAFGKNFVGCSNSIIGCFRIITRTEGVTALYKGMLPTLLKAAALSAVQFGAYDKILRLF